jgi:alpha-glucosidase
MGEDFSYVVVGERQAARWDLQEKKDKLVISTDSLVVEISREPVRFCFKTTDGQVINQDDEGLGITWVGDEVANYKALQEGEHFIGLGEKTGNLDRRGESHTNWNTDNWAYSTTDDEIYSSFPFYVGVHHDLAYGIYFDNSYRSHFNFGASNDRFSSFGADAGEMDYYFIFRSDIRGIIEEYTWLTGRMPMPPVWSLGFQQCRWSYYPDNEVITTARTFREKKIPLDVIYLDIHYMDAYKIFTWHPQRFPDPEKMLGQLADMGIHTTVIVDPGIKIENGYHAFEEGVKNDLFIKFPDGKNYAAQVWPGWCHFPDYTKPAARKWWGNSFNQLVSQGIDGFWNDMNEIASWGEGATPGMIRLDWDGRGANYRQGKNLYGMLMSRSTYEGTRSLMGNRRPLVLTRAACSGAQRYTAIWTGDNVASEEHMMLGCRLVNSLGISGMAFAGVDVGGFAQESTASLFARWISIGAFTPFFRVHKAYNQHTSEPWTYGEDVETIARNYITLRYRLLPYLYSAFYEAHTTGLPVNRSLVISHSSDSKCWQSEFQHQYFFGPSLLVAPVESHQKFTKVYLPAGTWYDFFTGQQYDGDQEVIVESPLEKLPVFAAGGAIIPMQSPVQSTSEKPSDTLFVHLYFGNHKTNYILYEDDGHTYNYEKGAYSLREFFFDPEQRQFVIRASEGDYPGIFSKIRLILHGFDQETGVWSVNGQPVKPVRSKIDLYSSVDESDPVYLWTSRTFQQEVLTLEVSDTGIPATIRW